MSPFAVEYWLGRCEGFRVDSQDGRLGFVEAVLDLDETGRPATLLVRGGPSGSLLYAVSVDEIDLFAAHEERIVLRRLPSPKE